MIDNNTKEQVENLLKTKFKPEFLNRIDDTVFFKGLTMHQLSLIVDIQIEYLKQLLKDKELHFEITQEAKDFLANKGYNPLYGARPLKRAIRQYIENPLAKAILENKFINGDRIVIDTNDEEITFAKK